MGVDKPNYTQIPNLILDDLIMHMNGAEFKVALAIARQTFGYHRERVTLTIDALQDLTGLSRPAVVESLNTGVRRNLIRCEQQPDGRWAYSLVINGEVLACSKESLPEAVKKVYRDSGKESLPRAVRKVNRRSKETLPESVKKVDQNTPVLKKGKKESKEIGGGDPTNQPRADVAVNSAEHALATALLIKVGVGGGTAKRLADNHGFVEIRRQVAAWLPERDAGKVETGALIHRIESGWGCGDLSPEFLRSELYRQFRTPDEITADEELEREAQQRMAELEASLPPAQPPAPAPAPPALGADDPWSVVLAELPHQLPADSPAHGWLKGSRLARVADVAGVPLYQVQVADEAGVGWLTNRLGVQLRKKLSVLLRQRVLIEVACVEREVVS